MKFKPISLAPKAPDDLPASSLLSSISYISPTGTLCSREVELLTVFQTCMLFNTFVRSFYRHYIMYSSPEPHGVGITVLIFQIRENKDRREFEERKRHTGSRKESWDLNTCLSDIKVLLLSLLLSLILALCLLVHGSVYFTDWSFNGINIILGFLK